MTRTPTFEELFRDCQRTAVHLEMRDAYMKSDPAFIDWKAGVVLDPAERWADWHAIVTEAAPSLAPKTWYGMPAWAKDGKVLCYFRSAEKFDDRYATFGFNDGARLDQGSMWPTSWALTDITPADAKKIAALVKKAAR